ncbi:MAG: NADPH-dependent glutamate synthase [Nitrososphaeria archaeon]|nr:NADPH-dependent glutamate synthase [Nitrososphaeria archaeon]
MGNEEKSLREMPQLLPIEERISTFKEVNLGFTEEQVKKEASRCLQCPKAYCMAGCPANVKIPKFINAIRQGNYKRAIEIICETNSLPAVTGRVCQVEMQCEKACILGRKGIPVSIGLLERFVADIALKRGWKRFACDAFNGKRVAVVGSGPAGLTVAGDLIKLGYEVTVFEALHKPGGVLVYGIPEFRLPKNVVEKEIKTLEDSGVKICTNFCVGKSITLKEIFEEGYDAVFLGIGAGAPVVLDVPGVNLGGIYTANEFLVRTVLMKAYLFPKYDTPIDFGKKVIVIGGGNTAVDSARVAVRMGVEEVKIAYRRSVEDMPARREEILRANEEGVKILQLVNPVRFIGDENNHVIKVELVKNQLTYIDETGRSVPVPIEGSNFYVEGDMVILAIGQKANRVFTQTVPQLKLDKEGYIIVDYEAKTSLERVWAGGDIIRGSATVIQAIGDGKRAAASINKTLMSNNI